jgi:hypothetical protein
MGACLHLAQACDAHVQAGSGALSLVSAANSVHSGGIVRRGWGVRARGSGVSAGQHLTKEEVDHVPTYPLSRSAAAMRQVQPACRGGP